MKKIFCTLLIFTILLNGVSINAKTDVKDEPVLPEDVIIESIDMPMDDDVTIQFVDNELVDANQSPKVFQTSLIGGVGTSTYLYTTYTYKKHNITSYDAKAPTNQKFLVSVPNGTTVSLTKDINVSGTMSFSGSVDANVKSAIAKAFKLSASGTLSYKWTKNTKFSFPKEFIGKYKICNYYTAISFDKANVTVERRDWYKLNGIISSPYSVNRGDITIKNVYIPKVIVYKIGTNYGQ